MAHRADAGHPPDGGEPPQVPPSTKRPEYVQDSLLDVEQPPRPPTPAEKFERFILESPAVYPTLVGLARDWVSRTGRHKIGIGALVERARWEIALSTNDPEYKIDNNHRPFLARLIMAKEPDLDGIFDLRDSIADEWSPRAAA